MSNQGLKPLTRQLSLPCPLGNLNVNLYEEDKNYILEIPLLSTPDGMKFPISYIYNCFNRQVSSYGNGGLLSLYAYYSYRGSSIQQIKADGATYDYSIGGAGYLSIDSSDYVTYSSGTFVLHSNGYSYEYNGNSYHLYNKITSPNGDTLTMISSSSTEIVYQTNYGARIKIQPSSTTLKLFSYIPDTDMYAYGVEITLTNSLLTHVKYSKRELNSDLTMGEYSIENIDTSPWFMDC